MCQNLLDKKDIFIEHFLEDFEKCANDPIDNVRISLAKVLSFHI